MLYTLVHTTPLFVIFVLSFTAAFPIPGDSRTGSSVHPRSPTESKSVSTRRTFEKANDPALVGRTFHFEHDDRDLGEDIEDLTFRSFFKFSSPPEEQKTAWDEKINKAQQKYVKEKAKKEEKANNKDSLSIDCVKCGSSETAARRRVEQAWKVDNSLHKFGKAQVTVHDGRIVTARYHNGAILQGGSVTYLLGG